MNRKICHHNDDFICTHLIIFNKLFSECCVFIRNDWCQRRWRWRFFVWKSPKGRKKNSGRPMGCKLLTVTFLNVIGSSGEHRYVTIQFVTRPKKTYLRKLFGVECSWYKWLFLCLGRLMECVATRSKTPAYSKSPENLRKVGRKIPDMWSILESELFRFYARR